MTDFRVTLVRREAAPPGEGKRTSSGLDGLLHGDAVAMELAVVPVAVVRRGRGRGGAAANGRLATAAGPGQLTLPDAVPPPDLPSATILSDRPRPRP